MKKLLLFSFLILALSSCKVNRTLSKSQHAIKGDWLLTSVTYNKTGNYNISLLNDTSADCLEGSQWNFIKNNTTGTYTVNKGNCPTGTRYFIYSIKEIDRETGLYDFLLKPTDIKKRSDDNHGFRLQLKKLSESDMQWEQTVSLDGKPFKIFMNFSKMTK